MRNSCYSSLRIQPPFIRLRYVVAEANERRLYSQAIAVGESWNLVLLFVTVEGTCCANVLSVARCVIRLDVSLTCHAVFEKIAGQVG